MSTAPSSRLSEVAALTLLVSTSLAIRLYPTLSSGLPFSTDAWPLIRNTELLLENTPVSLSHEVFDGYNNYWPASSIFGAVFSLISGLNPMVAMSISIPATAALGVLVFYALARRMFKNSLAAFLASMTLTAFFPYAFFTAGVVKEAYANPIYITLILVSLTLRGWRGLALFALSSIALSMAHHLTSAVALMVLTSIALSSCIWAIIRGLEVDWIPLALTSILASSIVLYYVAYAHEGFKVAISPSDLVTLASYQVLAFALALYVTYARSSSIEREIDSWTSMKCLVAAAAPLLILALCTFKQVTPDAPILPRRYILYGVPFAVSAPLALLGFRGARMLGDELCLKPIFWLAPVLGLEAYAVFGSQPAGLALAYRTVNFILPPLALLCGYGAYRLFSKSKRSLLKALVGLAVVLIVASSCYSAYAALRGERYMGYFWLYRAQEYESGNWISSFLSNKVVACDAKFAYMLKGYFGLSCNEVEGLLYLSGRISTRPDVLVAYDWMGVNGYVIYGGYSVDLPRNWLERVYELNLVHFNGVVSVYSSH